MISIIVCSVNLMLFEKLQDNIFESIGVEHEVIKIDNSIEKLSIARAYNKGAECSAFSNLLFVHEDIFFHTKEWGLILLEFLSTLNNPGVLGVAGSSYLPISPSDWWVPDASYLHINFLSNSKNGFVGEGKLKQSVHQLAQPVIALDGMFLAMKKAIWKDFPFDESLDGFHGYDTSICYRVSQKFQNYFIPGLLIEHFSKGYPNETWLFNTILSNRPILSNLISIKKKSFINKELEINSYHLFLGQLNKYTSSYKYALLQSTFYLLKINSCFISGRSLLIWCYFQFVYIRKFIK